MTLVNFIWYLAHIPPIISGSGFIMGLIFYKKLPGFYRSLVVFLGLMLLVERIMFYIANSTGSNYVVQPYYALIELVFFVFLYKKYMLNKNYTLLLILEITSIAYLIYEIIYYSLITTTAEQFQSYAKPLDNFIIILLSLCYLYENTNSFDASRFKYLWFNIIVLAYCSLSTFIFLPFNFMINQSTNLIFVFWLINIIALVVFYGFITYKIWRAARN
ncbi:hypothetical protein [Flavobacterium rhizosphaerae]|uniref:Uncharacterized protein n=1 Tax=Flavobacterium rhizosphaerae TaxID=3163298 RepID=A0ABW8YSA6_9FLAO